MAVNTVTLAGNLTRDPEIRVTKNNQTPVLNFSIAVNERFKNRQTGEWEDRPNFFDCVIFGSRANALAPYLSKGMKVCVSGSLRQNSWEQDGQKRSRIEVIVDNLDFVSPKRGNGSGGYQPNARTAPVQQPSYNQQPAPMPAYPQPVPAPQPAPQSAGYGQVYQDDLPF